jgi:predicted ABC-type ATPase
LLSQKNPLTLQPKMMKNLYIVSGCNGAGKTTASYTVLPEILECREFVNADEIARGLSPFNAEGVAIEAGKLMLQRIEELLKEDVTFAIETTLATRSYVNLVKRAQRQGYRVNLLYFWLSSPELAMRRVAERVSKGGHDIPEEIIRRRYTAGINNLFKLFMPAVDYWAIFDNSATPRRIVATGGRKSETATMEEELLRTIRAYVK